MVSDSYDDSLQNASIRYQTQISLLYESKLPRISPQKEILFPHNSHFNKMRALDIFDYFLKFMLSRKNSHIAKYRSPKHTVTGI